MTLIEVLAGVAILGTLLVAVLMTDVRCRRQEAAARDRLSACRAADTLLAEWFCGGEATIPRDGQGRLGGPGGAPALSWRTETVANPAAERLGLEVVRLTVWCGARGPANGSIHVDVVAPNE